MSDESRLTAAQRPARKIYGTPRLATYGDVTKLTKGHGHPDHGHHYGGGNGGGHAWGRGKKLSRSG